MSVHAEILIKVRELDAALKTIAARQERIEDKLDIILRRLPAASGDQVMEFRSK